jgi:hypothetical protein
VKEEDEERSEEREEVNEIKLLLFCRLQSCIVQKSGNCILNDFGLERIWNVSTKFVSLTH